MAQSTQKDRMLFATYTSRYGVGSDGGIRCPAPPTIEDLAKQGLLYGLRPNPQRNPMIAIRLRRPPWGNAPIDAATERYRFPA